MEEIKRERQLAPLPPVVLGGVLVVPIGLIQAMSGAPQPPPQTAVDTQAAAARARADRHGGRARPRLRAGRSGDSRSSATTSKARFPAPGRLRFIEVKGRVAGADTVTVTQNEILYSLNKPDDFILAMVEFLDDGGHKVHYVRRPFKREPDFAAASVNYEFPELLALAGAPS